MKGLLKEEVKVVAVVCSNPKHTNVVIYDFKRRKCNKGKNGYCQYNRGYLVKDSQERCTFRKIEEIEL